MKAYVYKSGLVDDASHVGVCFAVVLKQVQQLCLSRKRPRHGGGEQPMAPVNKLRARGEHLGKHLDLEHRSSEMGGYCNSSDSINGVLGSD
jgi:hypothetical protein